MFDVWDETLPPELDAGRRIAFNLLHVALSAIGVRRVVKWPVKKDNRLVVMNFDRRKIELTPVGGKIGVLGGGYVLRIDDDSWVQWQYFAAEPTEAVPTPDPETVLPVEVPEVLLQQDEAELPPTP